MTTSDNIQTCLICQKPVPDYEPQMCCSGRECGCMGQPTEPCLCSKECGDALFDGKGGDYDERRKRHGIDIWKPDAAIDTAEDHTLVPEAIQSARIKWQIENGLCAMCAVGDSPVRGRHRGRHVCGNSISCPACRGVLPIGAQCLCCNRIAQEEP